MQQTFLGYFLHFGKIRQIFPNFGAFLSLKKSTVFSSALLTLRAFSFIIKVQTIKENSQCII